MDNFKAYRKERLEQRIAYWKAAVKDARKDLKQARKTGWCLSMTTYLVEQAEKNLTRNLMLYKKEDF